MVQWNTPDESWPNLNRSGCAALRELQIATGAPCLINVIHHSRAQCTSRQYIKGSAEKDYDPVFRS